MATCEKPVETCANHFLITSYSPFSSSRNARKRPQPLTAGASWQSGSNVEFGPNPSCITSQSRTLLCRFAHLLGLVHLRQRFGSHCPTGPGTFEPGARNRRPTGVGG